MSTLLTKEVKIDKILKGSDLVFSETSKTREVTNEELKIVKDHWNGLSLTQVKKESDGFDRKVKRCIAKYNVAKLIELTSRYGRMYHDNSYFFNYKYVPTVFYCDATLEKFEDGGNLWEDYKSKRMSEDLMSFIDSISYYNDVVKEEVEEETGHENNTVENKELYSKMLNHLKTMPYASYLKTEHWRHFRDEVIKHYDGKCAVCNSEKDLNVHHRSYKNRGRETFNDVVLLCRDCHSKIHAISGETNE